MFRLPVSYVWFGYVCSQLFNAQVLSRYTRYVHIFFFSDCESNILHQDECRFFQDKDYQMKRRFSEFSSNSNSPLWITPLRMLLKKQTDPKMFDRINMLRDHTAPKVSISLWWLIDWLIDELDRIQNKLRTAIWTWQVLVKFWTNFFDEIRLCNGPFYSFFHFRAIWNTTTSKLQFSKTFL